MKKTQRKRGRPRKIRPSKIIWKLPEGVRMVARKVSNPQALTHRWLAVSERDVIGYYKTPEEAHKAYIAYTLTD